MTIGPEPASPEHFWRRLMMHGRGRWLGAGIALLIGGLLLLPDPGPIPRLRYLAFDSYQTLLPRSREQGPAVIVAIDNRSLARIGQWPWPRDTMARLLDRISARRPAVIAVDIVFAEPDRSSPEILAAQFRDDHPALADRLQKLPSHDAQLAGAMTPTPVVLGIIGSEQKGVDGRRFAPARIVGPSPALQDFRFGERSLPVIDAAASGHGLFNTDLDNGVVRRVPLVAMVAGLPLLSMPLESLRVAAGEPFFGLQTGASKRLNVVIGDLAIPAQSDGTLFVNYVGHTPARYLSALDVLEGRDDPDQIAGRVVLVGVTGEGLVDQQLIPNGERLPGVEIHAEVLENVYAGALLYRPASARAVELIGFVALAFVAVILVPRLSAPKSALLYLVSIALFICAGLSTFYWQQLLFDPLTPAVGLTLVYTMLILATMMLIEMQRRQLAERLAIERIAAARTAGELEAARRIQTGMLPVPESVLGPDRRVQLFAHMRPAREVGGDLYDFFYLQDRRLFLVIGDVAGKGLAAALFMAVSKALTKSSGLRGHIELQRLMGEVNRELSRDNPDDLFVTLLALALDLDSGRLEYCNAGHEPLLLVRADGSILALDEGGGPPLCVLESAVYASAEVQLQRGEVLVLASDGITEAMSPAGTLLGRDALVALLQVAQRSSDELASQARHVLEQVAEFESGVDPADDQTLVLLRWTGPSTARDPLKV